MTDIQCKYSPHELAEVAYLMGRIEGFDELRVSRSGSFFEHHDYKLAVAQISHADARLLELGFVYSPEIGVLKHCETDEKATLDTILLDLDFCEFTESAKEKALAERRRFIEETRLEMEKTFHK